MLADLEWKTPVPKPGGHSVAEWVDGVRWLERNGYLRDPEGLPHAGLQSQGAREGSAALCLSLCWRDRCKRARRCRHLMPLAVREWMPEVAILLSEIWDTPINRPNSFDEEKLNLLRELIK